MNIPSHLSRDETRLFLNRQIGTGRYMLLGTVIITVLDLVFLLCEVDFYIFYCAAAAYYPVLLGLSFDSQVGTGAIGSYTFTALSIAIIILAGFLLLWYMAKRSILWLKVGIGALAVDTALLAALYLWLHMDLFDCLWELVLHGAVIYEMIKAVQAHAALAQLGEPSPEAATV